MTTEYQSIRYVLGQQTDWIITELMLIAVGNKLAGL